MNETSVKESKGDTRSKLPLKKKPKNIFQYMESINESQGPKSLLYRAIKEKRPIKVWTRSHSYVRSICTGYLLAFDRFWNLVMIDVDEIYRVPNKSGSVAGCRVVNSLAVEFDDKASIDSGNQPRARDRQTPRGGETPHTSLNLYKTSKYNIYQRHMNQLLVRGDNIVFVVLM